MKRFPVSAFICCASIFIFSIILISCDPISLKTTIDNMILGWTRAVILTSPVNEGGVSEKTPFLDWEDAGGATGYQVQISETESFDGVTAIDIDEAVSEYEIPNDLTICDTRYWRVRAVKDGVASDVWSETWSFEIVPSSAPMVVGTFETRDVYPDASLWNVSVSGFYAYVPIEAPGLIVIDFSEPASPTQIGFYQHSSGKGVYHSDIAGNYVYCAETGGSPCYLRVLDVSDPSNPVLAGSSETELPSSSCTVATNGGVTMIGSGNNLNYYSTHNLSSITLKHTEPLGGNTWKPEIVGANCYIIVEGEGFSIYGTYTTGLLGSYSILGIENEFSGVTGSGNYAYISVGGSEGILILDCTNPGSPVHLGSYAHPDYTFLGALEASGHYLYSAASHGTENGVAVIDITNPSALELLGFVGFEGGGWFEVSGNYIVCPDYHSGRVYIIDLLPGG